MALKTDIRGMSHVYPDYFIVGREKVREYAKAIKAEDPASFDEKAAAEQRAKTETDARPKSKTKTDSGSDR